MNTVRERNLDQLRKELGGAVKSGTFPVELTEQLKSAGYVYGTTAIHRYNHPLTGRACSRLRVCREDMIYVLDHRQREDVPRAGEVVLFDPEAGYRIAPRVMAVNFIPVRPLDQVN